MKVKLKLKPGHHGAKKLAAQYGNKLVCVRYSYNKALELGLKARIKRALAYESMGV